MRGSHGGEDSCYGLFHCDSVWLVCCCHILYCTPPVEGGWSCGTCGIENEWVQGFGWRDCLGGLGIDWKIILKWITEMEWQDISWVHLSG